MIFTVAIDGPAASGKGTIARAIAGRFGLRHLDTGMLYRAVAWRSLQGEDAARVAAGLGAEDLSRPGLRQPEVAQEASRVAALPEVRAALTEFQRRFARAPGGAVLDGRDIGTVICPEAEVKLWVTASPEARAGRRHVEQVAAGIDQPLAEVLADVAARDARDAGRSVAPLRPAEDAVVIDTTTLSAEAAVATAIACVDARWPRG